MSPLVWDTDVPCWRSPAHSTQCSHVPRGYSEAVFLTLCHTHCLEYRPSPLRVRFVDEQIFVFAYLDGCSIADRCGHFKTLFVYSDYSSVPIFHNRVPCDLVHCHPKSLASSVPPSMISMRLVLFFVSFDLHYALRVSRARTLVAAVGLHSIATSLFFSPFLRAQMSRTRFGLMRCTRALPFLSHIRATAGWTIPKGSFERVNTKTQVCPPALLLFISASGALVGGACFTPRLHDGVCPTRTFERQALCRGRVRAFGSVLGFEEHPEVSAPVVMGFPIFNHPPSGRDLLAHLRPMMIGVGRAPAYSSRLVFCLLHPASSVSIGLVHLLNPIAGRISLAIFVFDPIFLWVIPRSVARAASSSSSSCSIALRTLKPVA